MTKERESTNQTVANKGKHLFPRQNLTHHCQSSLWGSTLPSPSGGRQSRAHKLSWSWWRRWCRWPWHRWADAPPESWRSPLLLLHQVRHPSRKVLVCFSNVVHHFISFLIDLLNYEICSRKMKHGSQSCSRFRMNTTQKRARFYMRARARARANKRTRARARAKP